MDQRWKAWCPAAGGVFKQQRQRMQPWTVVNNDLADVLDVGQLDLGTDATPTGSQRGHQHVWDALLASRPDPRSVDHEESWKGK